MSTESKPNSNNKNNKKRKQRYLPHNKSVKKGSYPLHPGVQGFFLTCDGGREHQATHEAINVIDNFYEELVHHGNSLAKLAILPDKPQNKIIKFSDSDSSSDDGGDDGDNKSDCHKEDDSDHANLANAKADSCKKVDADHGNEVVETIQTTAKKQRIETDALKSGNAACGETEEKSIDRLIEAELKELGDRNKRRFVSLDSGCNGVVFVKMHKIDGDPGPAEIVQHMMTSAASTRKHMSRFILRVLPVEVACYASEEEISKAIKPLITLHFPAEAPNPQKFAVLYEARANTGIERMSIINSIAKSVPGPHKVDLNNPDKTIIVQIVKTVCLIGVVEKYKELAKYNLRQLTSPKP